VQEPVLWAIRIDGGEAIRKHYSGYATFHPDRTYPTKSHAEESSYIAGNLDGDRLEKWRRKATIVPLYAAPLSAPPEAGDTK
jgi:hypothetical protein